MTPKMTAYHERCAEYFKIAGKAVEIKPDTPEWDMWGAYFLRTLGCFPVTFDLRRRGLIKAFCVPAQMPEWFDQAYVTHPPTGRELGLIRDVPPIVTQQERDYINRGFERERERALERPMTPDQRRRAAERRQRIAEQQDVDAVLAAASEARAAEGPVAVSDTLKAKLGLTPRNEQEAA